jgi:hypothetical protein
MRNSKRSLLLGLNAVAILALAVGGFFVVQSKALPARAAPSIGVARHLSFVGTAAPSGATGTAANGGEFAPTLDADAGRAIPTGAPSPGATLPAPAALPIAATNPGFSGFDGLTHLDSRLAGTGIYANTQFNGEPPDQALCVGNGFVLEGVNTVFAVYNTSGARLTAPTAYNEFFKLRPQVVRTPTVIFEDDTSDPKCLYDAATNRFFMTILKLPLDPVTSAFVPRVLALIAVSQTGDPTGAWNMYSLDLSDDGQNGTPSHAHCPCLGDQPLIGADANGFYISTNEFALFPFAGAFFNGAQVYAMAKRALAAGVMPPVVQIDAGALPTPDAGGIWGSLQPATAPRGDDSDEDNGDGGRNHGTEYLLSSLDFFNTLDNRIAVWALTNTRSLNSATPTLGFTHVVIGSESYGFPPDALQKDGPIPLGAALGEPLEKLAGNDDRMNQVVFAAGKLWSGVNTVVSGERVGVAYFIVTPGWQRDALSARVANQGYVTVAGQSTLYPSIGVNAAGRGAITFTVSGPDFFPSAAYASIDAAHGAGAVHIAAAGVLPEDGFTGYVAFGGNGSARWGDYSAAVADAAGNIWLAQEYIPNAPRNNRANWGTFVSRVTPQDD